MLKRCYKPSNHAYHRYGGRGIAVSTNWHDFNTFCEWALANGSSKELQLDRIDNDGDYEPDNCRFVAVKVNQNNRSNNKIITAWGEAKTLSNWALDDRCKVTYRQAQYRITNLGWDAERALTAPIDKTRRVLDLSHCKNGHEYTEQNTYRTPSAPHLKKCRKCHLDRQSKRSIERKTK